MNDLLARACDVFVAPAVERRAAPVVARAPRPDSSIALLGPSPDASALAIALARRLRRDCRAAVAVVAEWEPVAAAAPPTPSGCGGTTAAATTSSGLLAAPAASTLARRLLARGLVARAAGRLVRVALPVEPDQCSVTLMRLRAASADAASVTSLRGPLTAWMLPMLAEHDRVLVHLAADAAPELAPLAAAGLRDAGIAATPIAWTPGPITRALVHRGLLACPAPPAPCLEAAR